MRSRDPHTGEPGSRVSAAEVGAVAPGQPRSWRNRLNENLLVFCCLSSERTAQEWLRRLVALPLDWHYVVAQTRFAMVAPLVGARLSRIEDVPQSVLQRLRDLWKRNVARNVRIHVEAQRLLEALHRSGAQPMLLKGLALTAGVYSDPAFRIMEDVDLLVRRDDLERAKAAMTSLAYSSVRHDPAPNHHLLPFISPQGFLFEIHWQPIADPHPFRIDEAYLWDTARTIEFGAVPVQVPSPEVLAWHIAVHESFQHAFARAIRAMADLDALDRRFSSDLDWGRVRDLARKTRTWDHVRSMLYLTGATLGGQLRHLADLGPPRRLERLAARGSHRSPRRWDSLLAAFLPGLALCPHNRYAPDELEFIWTLAGVLQHDMHAEADRSDGPSRLRAAFGTQPGELT